MATMTRRRKKKPDELLPPEMGAEAQDEPDEQWVTRSFRLPRELLEWLDREADARRRKTNNYLEYILAKLKAKRDQDRAG